MLYFYIMGGAVGVLPPASPQTQEECIVLWREFLSSILMLWNHHCKRGLSLTETSLWGVWPYWLWTSFKYCKTEGILDLKHTYFIKEQTIHWLNWSKEDFLIIKRMTNYLYTGHDLFNILLFSLRIEGLDRSRRL